MDAALLSLLVLTATVATSSAAEDEIIIIDDDSDDTIVIDASEEQEPLALFDVRARVSTRFDSRLSIDTSFDRANEQVAELLVGGALEIDADFTTSLSAYAAPRFSYVAALDREGDDRAILYFLTPEAWVRYAEGGLSLRVGAMTWAWGSSDLVSPNDNLNPVDYRQGALTLAGGTKIPVVGAEAVVTTGPLTFRGVIAPFFTASRFHLTSWDFSVLSGRPLIGLPQETVDAAFSPAYVDAGGDQVLLTDRPSQRLDNATLGGRATLALDDLDVSFTAVHGWDSVPRLVLDDDLAFVASKFAEANAMDGAPPFSDPEVLSAVARLQDKSEMGQTLFRGEVLRRTVFGVDASWAVDPFVLKADVAYTLARTVYDQNFDPFRLPWLNAVVGLEYYWTDRLQIIVEAFAIVVRDVLNNKRLNFFEPRDPPPSTLPDGDRDVVLPGAVAAMFFSALDGELRFELGLLATFTRGDFGIAPAVTWRVDDHHQLTLGGFALEGTATSIGGAYTNTDQVYVAYRFSY
ncbi:MAG: hypothetical protein RIT81_46065 [Deltaproteobacteria bacterium]